MFMVFVLIVLLVLPGSSTKVIADAVVVALLAVIVAEGWFVGRKVKRLAASASPARAPRAS